METDERKDAERERWARVRQLVEEAMELPAAERAAYVQRHAADEGVERDAARLLSYEDSASAIFSGVGAGRWQPERAPEDDLAGGHVGAYRILSELGRGGMGVVYLAERADGAYAQKVAMKVLQEGVNTPGLAERFLQERQILAGLTHPGIARLLDGGVLPDGRPYLVLEYVDGVPIDQYCEARTFGVRERLELVLCVAEAVQSAHQKLVLHLDLKPANILVTADGEPRLLDFGIARFLSEMDGGKAEVTTRLLTPRYASPEQAAGVPLGVASDVFSLATLTYKLVTGVLPYPLEEASPLQAAQIIQEQPPMPPSQAAPERRAELRGDLDMILLQALRKEPERRYATVAEFAADLRRHLDSKPVRAHSDSFGYRTAKFVRRNRVAVAAASVAAVVLLVSAGLVVRSEIAARRSQRLAEEQRAVAQRRLQDVRGLAHSYIFDLDPKLEQVPGTVAIRGLVLQNGLKYLEAMSKENVADDDDLLREVGMGYMRVAQVQADPAMPSLNDRQGAWDSMRKGLALQQRLLAKHPQDLKQLSMVARQLAAMEYLAMADGEVATSYGYAMQSWSTIQPLLTAGPAAPRYLHLSAVPWDIANLYAGNGELWNLGDPAAALPWLDRMHDIVAKYAASKPGGDQDATVLAQFQREYMARADTLTKLGRGADARALYEGALRIAEAHQEKIEDKQSLTVIRESYAEWALRQRDLATVRRLAPLLTLEADDGKPHDRNLALTIADALCQTARIDFVNGHVAAGLQKMKRSVDSFEKLYAEDPDDATGSAVMTHDFYQYGSENAVPVEMRRHMFARAAEVATTYGRKHPEALSADVLIGQCEVGLAALSQDAAERKQHAERAQAELGKVVGAHPSYVEARASLEQARELANL